MASGSSRLCARHVALGLTAVYVSPAMDARSLRALEFEKIVDMLARHASTSMGAERCRRLRPRTEPQWIKRRLEETEQARRLIGQQGPPPMGGLTDIRPLLAKAHATPLSESELLSIADAARALTLLRDYYDRGRDTAPRLWRLAERIADYSELTAAVEAAIDDEAQVRPDASAELRRLTAQARRIEEEMRSRLEEIMRRMLGSGILQEPIVVQRSGRWCLAVKSSQQARFNGILHDRSDSGATVFMEPAETVELGNRLRATEIAIRQEIARILAQLTALVRRRSAELRRDTGIAASLDFITAKALLADEMRANQPALRDDGYLELRSARHPLLRGEVVPIDIWIGREFTTLVITGPNTGGKTVTLKTVGLLTLMAQAGLHIPAGPTSQVNVFSAIFADIGDEQSIEQSLSTFSSHMTQVVRIINQVTARVRSFGHANDVLVLLDEIGAGTDPAEGSALARGILDALHEAGCRVIATTHYNDLKTFAYLREGMENAAVEFDIKTLRPTYKLRIGHAGPSQALEIAQRLGLPRKIVHAARELLGRRGQQVDAALRRITESQKELEREHQEISALREELEKLRAAAKQELERVREQQRRLAAEGFSKARRIVAEAEKEARQILAALRACAQEGRETQQLRDRLAKLREKVEAEEAATVAAEAVGEPSAPPVRVGEQVILGESGRAGVLEEIRSDGIAVVRLDKLTVELPVVELRPASQPEPRTDGEAIASRMRSRKALTAPRELDVRGMTVEEAIYRLEKFLDDAVLAGYDRVRIIHGKGTGALRQGIHQWLREHPAVRRYELAPLDEGGSGATIVFL
ncbi:MAG: endonuclease MutS2 [Armatimonadetes bacterium]|nr:endonuclease MutS2 [Armatimonadota bacterium]